MATMRPPLHPFRAGPAPVVLMVLLAVLTGGCSSDSDADADEPTVTATAADSETPAETETAPPSPTSGQPETTTGRSETVAAACAPYVAMVDAIKAAAGTTDDPDEVAAEIGPVLKEFASVVPTLDRPRGIAPGTWRGVVALATEIGKLPDPPTDAEIEAVEGRLSDAEQEAVEDAFSWFQTNCT